MRLTLLILALVLVLGCTTAAREVKPLNCNDEGPCYATGCEEGPYICSTNPEPPITCVNEAWHRCLEIEGVRCACVDEECKWIGPPEFAECVENAGP